VPSVAIVDDEEGIRKALGRLLRASGIETQGYANGQEFLTATAEQRPDCVVLDLHMPGMSGLQVLRRLKTTGQLWRVVVITAHDEPETREQCLNAGACAYLRKPLEDRLLLNAISAAMRSHPTMIKR
jgi:FixJ family two-component response regulator